MSTYAQCLLKQTYTAAFLQRDGSAQSERNGDDTAGGPSAVADAENQNGKLSLNAFHLKLVNIVPSAPFK